MIFECKSFDYGLEEQERFDTIRRYLAKVVLETSKKEKGYELIIGIGGEKMKKFYRNQYKIVLMLVLTLIFQIVGPVAGGSVYADKATGETFQVSNTSVDEDGKAEVNWNLRLKSSAGVMKYEHEVDLTLGAEASEALIANDGTVIGSYIVSKEGIMTATIDSATDILSRGDFTTGAAIDGSDIFTADFAGSFKVGGAQSKRNRRYYI